jgi:hypothetical protein
MDFRAIEHEHLRDQESQLAISKNGDRLSLRDPDLVQNFASRRNRFSEYSVIGRNIARDMEQVLFRQSEELLERAGMFDDPEHRALRTMTPESTLAPVAFTASEIDLAHHAPADPLG